MAWFENKYRFDKSAIKIAHITDCHLFEDDTGKYFSVNTAENFQRTLNYLATLELDAIIFGGDLTQDHTTASYQLFAKLITESPLKAPVFWLPGNHDELQTLEEITEGQILGAKHIQLEGADVLLVNSKGHTPAGWCEKEHLSELQQVLLQSSEQVLVFCHHHPLPINGYLDKHILENGPELLNCLVNSGKVAGLIHGHVHNEYHYGYRAMSIVATPATSIQFSKCTEQWQQQNLGPAVRIINLGAQVYDSEVIWLDG
ncbi:3',5'-cyclic-nucleotide phosphodiesterase [Pseudoalteromonas sp. MSK9-3]|uniref:metallophosphoesterase n=1 Tax=Pseudoalteromonas sp. MSK9-3 TaxID=1897633 RepID=UPI000E6C9F74|nr:metallophosphoesterase [Pseudoalteromonas sp. MSK9-3]RJE76721.1 3',5'-cyclic-nucleotide phosphodiesterase [Pseudoalteromonas sp. MSK9-3]